MTLSEQFKMDIDDIADMYVKVSGDLLILKDKLQGKRVIEWDQLEDYALEKPLDSEEYQVLLKVKGMAEVEKRKEFLMMTEQEVDE